VVITFEPHPREIVGRGPIQRLTTLDERLVILEGLGIDLVLVLEFTYAFSRLTPREFYERYVIRGVGVRQVVVGHDHMFGRDREAGIAELGAMGGEFGFEETTVPPVTLDGAVISSSRIREDLLRGQVERAAQMLGRPYSLGGTVVRGEGRGASLGFPTANIQPLVPAKLIPAEGVYCVGVRLEGGRRAYGMMNMGVRPTFSTTLERTIEVHILDLDESLYGRTLTVDFLKRLRPEKKFSSAADLAAQLRADREECLKYIGALQPAP
jgi:riboflavin kinase/FMN adenylyltransferase